MFVVSLQPRTPVSFKAEGRRGVPADFDSTYTGLHSPISQDKDKRQYDMNRNKWTNRERETETDRHRTQEKSESRNDESWIEIYIWNTNKCMYVRAVTYHKKMYACRPVAIGCVDVESGRRIEDCTADAMG